MADDEVDGGRSLRADLDARLEGCRRLLDEALAGVSEEDARRVVVPDRPALLGVVRHTAFVQGVWFVEAVTGASRQDVGIPVSTANSWKVRRSDTVRTVLDDRHRVEDLARTHLARLDLEDVVHGRGARTVRSLMTHVLEELAWNTGQADVLRAALQQPRS